ncbi:MAG: HisA/HisF-related TIM barrel protein, partial [Gemmatimonadaceae bacterium]
VARAVHVPVIASGGAGSPSDVRAVLDDGEADAALVAGMLHDGTTTVREIKNCLAWSGVVIRQVA